MAEGSVLVTGALGCIGAWTVRRLLSDGMRVVALDRSADARRLRQVTAPDQLEQVRLIEGDLTDLSAMEQILASEGVDRVIHLGALQLPFCRADPPLGALVNVVGTVNVFEAARRAGIGRVVYTSSIAVFQSGSAPGSSHTASEPTPASHYGVYKLANEGTARAYWEDFGISSIGVRPMTVYGPGRDRGLTSAPTKAMLAAVLGCRYRVGFGGSTLFQYVGDVARSLVAAVQSSHDGAHVVNLDGVRAPIVEVVAVLRELLGTPADGIDVASDPLPFPDEIDTAGLELLGPPPVTPFAAGIAATVEFFRDLQERDLLVPEEHGLHVSGDHATDSPVG
jgi:nucleoside-diphosphate-sugar epimerase